MRTQIYLTLLNSYWILGFAAFLMAFVITIIAIPVIIKVAEMKQLFDEPDYERKSHIRKTPTLGGVAIFAGLTITFSLFKDFLNLLDVKYLVPALIIIFFAGIKDDILVLTPLKKLFIQFVCAFLIVFLGNIKINSFYGLFGLQEIPYFFSVIFTMLAVVTIINCYNLIDGSDGLAGLLGFLSSMSFGVWFILTEHGSLTILALALAGCLLGFLFFNWQPAKIFMGDTGAMILGFTLSILSIHFIEFNKARNVADQFWIHASPSVAIGVMAIPIFDMLRVFMSRVLRKKSPFNPDRQHIHHLLIDHGFSHQITALILFSWSLFLVLTCVWLRETKSSYLLVLLILLAFVPAVILQLSLKFKKSNSKPVWAHEKK